MLYLLPRLTFKKDLLNLVFYTVTTALVFVAFSTSNHLAPALIFGVLFDLIWTARKHIIPAITNKFFESHNRATGLSSISFVSNLGAAILVPIAAFIFTQNYAFSIIPTILIAVLLYIYSKNLKSTAKD